MRRSRCSESRAGCLACVDGAHLADEVVAQGVQGCDGGLLVLSRTVTVRVLTVLVLRLTDSSLLGRGGCSRACSGRGCRRSRPSSRRRGVRVRRVSACRRRSARFARLEAVDELGPPVDDLHLMGFRAQLVVDVMEEDGGAPPSVAQAGDPVAQHRVVADELLDALRQTRRLLSPRLRPASAPPSAGATTGSSSFRTFLTFP